MSWNTQGNDTVTVLLAGPKNRSDVWQTALAKDARFRVSAIANAPDDLMVKLASRPDVVLVDSAMFGDADGFVSAMRSMSEDVYVVLPQLAPNDEQGIRSELAGLPHLKGLYAVDMNLQTLVEKIFADTRAAKMASSAGAWGAMSGNGHRPVTARIITVWNIAGGVGKTTIASSLAYLASQRGYPTLLIGMGSPPDDLPMMLRLSPEPNLAHWPQNPTVEGLRVITQKVGSMNVLGGFVDDMAAGQMSSTNRDSPGSFQSLINTAIREYAVVVIDTPPSSQAALALGVSNHLVLVGTPSMASAMRTAEAYRMVFERMAGMHSLSETTSYLALNRAGKRVEPRDWHRWAAEAVSGGFLPLIATIPDNDAVGIAQDERVIPVERTEAFRGALMPLADALFSENYGSSGQSGRTKSILGVKVRY